jgi:hypothetical protein
MAWTGVPCGAGKSMPSWKSQPSASIRGPNDVFISSGVVLWFSGHR